MFEEFIVPDEEPKYVDDPFGLAKDITSRGETKEPDSMPMERQELGNQGLMPVQPVPEGLYQGSERSVTGYGNSCILPVQQSYFGYSNQMDLMVYKNNLDIARSQEKEMIKTGEIFKREVIQTEETAKREMNRADIASIGSFQKISVFITGSGQVIVGKEQFGKDLSGMAGFRVVKCRRLYCLNDNTSSILEVQFCKEDITSTLLLSVEEMSAKSVDAAFRKAGIAFGFKNAKEKSCRELLIAELLKTAEKVSLPKRHGWYRGKNGLCYAYPEDETWEGVEAYAK